MLEGKCGNTKLTASLPILKVYLNKGHYFAWFQGLKKLWRLDICHLFFMMNIINPEHRIAEF